MGTQDGRRSIIHIIHAVIINSSCFRHFHLDDVITRLQNDDRNVIFENIEIRIQLPFLSQIQLNSLYSTLASDQHAGERTKYFGGFFIIYRNFISDIINSLSESFASEHVVDKIKHIYLKIKRCGN